MVDAGAMISADTQGRLEAFLYRLKDAGGPEIQVVTVDNLGGASVEEAALKVAEAWGIGNKKDDNGIILFISKTDRKVRIETGYGSEGSLPDVTASRIIREVVIPNFQNGDVDRGVTNGVLAIVHYTYPQFLDGENTAPEAKGLRKQGKRLDWVFFVLFFLFFILPLITGRRRRRSGLGPFLLGYGLGGLGRGGGGGGGWGSGSGSSWGGGGGGFGGGGASGSW